MNKRSKKKASIAVDRNKFIESVYHIIFIGNVVRNFNTTLLSVGEKLNETEKMTIKNSIQ